jgi:predicted PurR-regulated permease PerM
MSLPSLSKRIPLPGLVTGLLIVIILYFGKPVLMPLALAGLFTFLLSPLVNALYRLRLPRALAVVLVSISVFSLLGFLGWVIGREFSSLAASLPNYKDNIRHRIVSFHESGRGGVIENLKDIRTTIAESSAAAQTPLPPGVKSPAPADPPAASPAGPPAAQPSVDRPIPAVGPGPSNGWLNGVLGSAGEGLGNAATVVVFVIFMLLRQQELRNRVMRLAGFRHVTIVTRTMDETSDRVGRYLLMQALINGFYGVILGIGLYFIGLPYVVLWGVLAALFRFVPYIGPVVVAILPSALSLAVFPDWQHPLMVMALIACLELVTNMIVEPVLYGHSVGVSEFALLVAIVFWTWLWGGIGLVMATPLTVCFVVVARHIPALAWVEILMGDNPKVKPYMVLYQRLLAGDETEAEAFIQTELKTKTPLAVIDETILPAIALARRESTHARLTDNEEQLLHDAVLRVMSQALPKIEAPPPPANANHAPLMLGWPMGGAADDAALRCLALLVLPGLTFEIVPSQRLTGEFHAEIEARQPAAIVISATPPASHDTTRLQLRRLRREFPKLRIYVGRWGVPEDIAKAEPLLQAGANAVFTKLAEVEAAGAILIREMAAIAPPALEIEPSQPLIPQPTNPTLS